MSVPEFFTVGQQEDSIHSRVHARAAYGVNVLRVDRKRKVAIIQTRAESFKN